MNSKPKIGNPARRGRRAAVILLARRARNSFWPHYNIIYEYRIMNTGTYL